MILPCSRSISSPISFSYDSPRVYTGLMVLHHGRRFQPMEAFSGESNFAPSKPLSPTISQRTKSQISEFNAWEHLFRGEQNEGMVRKWGLEVLRGRGARKQAFGFAEEKGKTARAGSCFFPTLARHLQHQSIRASVLKI